MTSHEDAFVRQLKAQAGMFQLLELLREKSENAPPKRMRDPLVSLLPPSTKEHYDQLVAFLGSDYSGEDFVRALNATKGNVRIAANWMLDNCKAVSPLGQLAPTAFFDDDVVAAADNATTTEEVVMLYKQRSATIEELSATRQRQCQKEVHLFTMLQQFFAVQGRLKARFETREFAAALHSACRGAKMPTVEMFGVFQRHLQQRWAEVFSQVANQGSVQGAYEREFAPLVERVLDLDLAAAAVAVWSVVASVDEDDSSQRE